MALLSTLPPGAAVPGLGVVLAFVVFLAVVIGINACWELLKGPPNP